MTEIGKINLGITILACFIASVISQVVPRKCFHLGICHN